jgi:flavin reductase (DIM6/NTAB) family NADH-FMN oxidoreductase RutF
MSATTAASAADAAHFTTRVGSVGTEDMLSADDFKAAFRNHPAGVAVITADAGDGPVGLTATSVISVSANPALLVFSLSAFSSSAPALAKAETLVVHLLGADQMGLAKTFAAGHRGTRPAQRPHLAARPDRGPHAGR